MKIQPKPQAKASAVTVVMWKKGSSCEGRGRPGNWRKAVRSSESLIWFHPKDRN